VINLQSCIENSRITNQALHSFSSTGHTFQWYTVSCPYLSQYLNRLFRISKLHQHKWNDKIALSINFCGNCCISSTKQFFLSAMLVIFGVYLITFQHCTSYMIIYWHIYLVHFLLFLHQNPSSISYLLTKMYFWVQMVVIFKSNQTLQQNLLHIWYEFSLYKLEILWKNLLQLWKWVFPKDCFFIGTPCSIISPWQTKL